ncbi:Fic family protein [Desulfobacter sp.]
MVHDDLSETAQKILNVCKKALSGPELLGILGYKSRTRNFRIAMADLMERDLIEMTLPETPKSKNQKYRLTQSGLHLVENLNRTAES